MRFNELSKRQFCDFADGVLFVFPTPSATGNRSQRTGGILCNIRRGRFHSDRRDRGKPRTK
jgi:hypothetical protein